MLNLISTDTLVHLYYNRVHKFLGEEFEGWVSITLKKSGNFWDLTMMCRYSLFSRPIIGDK